MNDFQPEPTITSMPKRPIATTMLAAQSPTIAPTRARQGASEPGPWRTSRVPFLGEIMDVLSPDHPSHRVVFVKSAQVGGTEVGLNWMGWIIDTQRAPITTANFLRYVDEKRFDGTVFVEPEVYFTDDDLTRGYSWHLAIKLYANNMMTVQTLYLQAFRMEDLESAAA